jgi:hypothetical protein
MYFISNSRIIFVSLCVIVDTRKIKKNRVATEKISNHAVFCLVREGGLEPLVETPNALILL